MNKAIKYRIYPTIKQEILINKTFGCCRKIWNLMLSDKIDHYKEYGESLSVTPAKYKTDYPYLSEVDSLALANVQINLQKAYTSFFRDKRVGFPKYKSAKRSKRSYTTNCQGKSIELGNGMIKLPKLKWVKAKIHRLPLDAWNNWIIKSATISRDSDGKYYCSVLYEYDMVTDNHKINLSKDKVIGLDYSAPHLYVDSNGNKGGMPKYYKELHKRLAKEQKRLSRKVGSRKGESKSSNWLKQYYKVNKIHKCIANKRRDFLHKTSTKIANSYDVVGIEDLSVKEQLSNRTFKNFHKSTMDNGWYMFTQMLSYKMEDRGKLLVKIDKNFPSSKRCHCCGHINEELTNDSIRKWECPKCGSIHDRDINAAINIRDEAIKVVFG